MGASGAAGGSGSDGGSGAAGGAGGAAGDAGSGTGLKAQKNGILRASGGGERALPVAFHVRPRPMRQLVLLYYL